MKAVHDTVDQPDDDEMSEVVERLRKSKLEVEERDRKRFIEKGRYWAERIADGGQLARLDALDVSNIDYDLDELQAATWIAVHDRELDRRELSEWAETFGSNLSAERLMWWLEGVDQVWTENADKI